MKYDDASWHYGGDFPADLPPEAGVTHIGMFVTWALLQGFVGEVHKESLSPDYLERARQREITPGSLFIELCDEKFTDEDLDEDGNAFARAYYETSRYFKDYGELFAEDGPSLYHTSDSWITYDRLKPLLDRRLEDWRKSKGSLWWRLRVHLWRY